jgi:hypothetical protein
MLIAVVALAGAGACGNDADDVATDRTEVSTAVVDVEVDAELLTIHPVLGELPPPCADATVEPGQLVVGDTDVEPPTSCLVLGPAAIDATAIAEAELVATEAPDRFGVAVSFDATGTQQMNELAQEQWGERIAMLFRGRFVSAPTIEQPSFAGDVLVADLTEAEAVELVGAVGGDTALPEPVPVDEDMDRATAVCESFADQVGEGAELVIVMPQTAGSAAGLPGGDTIEPWRSLPADHFVAGCGYSIPAVGAPPTSICPNGEAVSLEPPHQFFVDEEGRSTVAPVPDVESAPPCPPADAGG